MSTASFIYSQLFSKLPVPTHDFNGQTVVITGGNTGLGLEAARYIVGLNASRVILGVRTLSKGEAAKADIEKSTGRSDVIDIYHVDMENYDSVKSFATEVSKLSRVDAVSLNAGKIAHEFYLAEQDESTITVNVVSTMLLGILLLPKLRESAKEYGTCPRLSIVASDRHMMTNLPEWKTPNTFETLRNNTQSGSDDRYYASKMLEVLLMRQIAKETAAVTPRVVITALTPGLCWSGLTKEVRGSWRIQLWVMKHLLARTTEEGGRILVHALALGWEGHGKYLNDCKIDEDALSPFVRSDEAAQAQEKVWNELLEKLEAIQPGISELVKS